MNQKDAKKIVYAKLAKILQLEVDEVMPNWLYGDDETGRAYTPTEEARMQRAVDAVVLELQKKTL